jgi:hypothetical protein
VDAISTKEISYVFNLRFTNQFTDLLGGGEHPVYLSPSHLSRQTAVFHKRSVKIYANMHRNENAVDSDRGFGLLYRKSQDLYYFGGGGGS